MVPFILVTVLFFVWGIPNNLNDVLIRHFMKSFEISRFQAGLVQSAFYMGYFVLAIPAALLVSTAICLLQQFRDSLSSTPIIGALSTAISGQGWLPISLAVLVCAIGLAFIGSWLKRPHPDEEHDGKLMRLYVSLLRLTLKPGMRWLILAIGFGSFVMAVQGMSALPSDFVPKADESRVLASVR